LMSVPGEVYREEVEGRVRWVSESEKGVRFRVGEGEVFVFGGRDIGVGDLVRVDCEWELPEAFDGFRYDRYLASKGVWVVCRDAFVEVVERSVGGIDDFRADLMMRFDVIYGEPRSTLLAGLLFGEQGFDARWEERFVETGTMHVVAASGYNVYVVVVLVSGCLFWCGIDRQRAFMFILISIVGYVMFAGGEAPVVRAGVMGVLALLGRFIGRKTSMSVVILFAVSLMLLFNPRLMRDDVGFQLSVLSTIGLVYVAPWMSARLKWVPERFEVRESVVCTLSSTMMALPVIVVSFGMPHVVSIPANVFLLPMIPYAMGFGAAGVVIDGVHSGLALPVVMVAEAGLDWMLLVVRFMYELI